MLVKGSTGLIVVDVQGKLAGLVNDSEAVQAAICRLIKGAQILELPIIWLEQNPHKLGRTVEAINDLLAPQHHPIEKYHFCAGKEAVFGEAVMQAGVSHWLVCGIESHICVYQTVAGLLESGYQVEVVTDAVSSRTEANRGIGMTKMCALGARVTSVEMCLYELVQDCRSKYFKPILQLVK